MIRNILFDWSGTLVDDLPAVWRATNFVLAQASRPQMTLEEFRAEFCLPFSIFYDRHVPKVPVAELEIWYHRHFREVEASVCELPHARAFLECCRSRRIRAFLLSTIHPDHFTVQSRATGFGEFLERAYVGVADKRRKIHEIIAENGLDPSETLFIGDMQHDVETAHHGGVHSCAVLTGFNTLDQLRAARPELIVEHLGELRGLLEESSFEFRSPVRRFEEKHPPLVTVGALIFDDAGRVLMVRTHKWSDLWGIPGGKIKWGEPAIDALRREVREETNLQIRDIRFVLVQDCIHSKEFYRDAHFVLLNYTCHCEGAPQVRLNEEAREYRWVGLDDALTMPLNTPTRVLLRAVHSPAGAPGGKG